MSQPLRALLVLCSLTVTVGVYGQDADSPQIPEASLNSTPIEEITVVGQRTFRALRLEIESAEIEAYNLFNDLNVNDEFDVTCTYEVYTGSHFPKRACMAAYLREAQARNIQDTLQGFDVQLSLGAVQGEVIQKTMAMEAEMVRVAQENQRFAEALQKLAELLGIYQKKKKENPFYFGQ